MTTPEQLLSEQAAAILEVVRASGGRIRPPNEIRVVSLADFFRYNVIQGGFAQLLYNAQGEYLGEIESMLLTANARVAHGFYVRAIELCLSDTGRYQEFLASDYTEDNVLKNALHGLSIEYFRLGLSFAEEAESFIQSSLPHVERWVTQQIEADA